MWQRLAAREILAKVQEEIEDLEGRIEEVGREDEQLQAEAKETSAVSAEKWLEGRRRKWQ